MSKSSFGVQEVEYLSNMISVQGLATNPKKVVAMKD